MRQILDAGIKNLAEFDKNVAVVNVQDASLRLAQLRS